MALLGAAIEEKGGKVVSSRSFHFQALKTSAETLVAEVLDRTAG